MVHSPFFLNDRANSPEGPEDTGVYKLCINHVPKNAVIYVSATRETRDWHGNLILENQGRLL